MLMRLIAGLVAIMPALVISAGVVAGAETPRKHSLIEAIGLKQLIGWPPNGADVLRFMHQFDLFQFQAAGVADSRGDTMIREFSVEQAQLARQRDDEISRLNAFTSLNIDFPKQPTLVLAGELAGLQGTVGQDFVGDYTAKQTKEFRRVIGLLRRYLRHPDSDPIRRFAGRELAILQRGLDTLQAQAPS